MRFFIISSAILVILVQCGYPVPENSYLTTPSYPVPPPSYSVQSSISLSDSSSFSNYEDSSVGSESTSTSEFRKRAKARTAHNRQFQRRALQPIRRFQQKKQ